MTATDTPEPTDTELAASAAEAIRALNHRTWIPAAVDAPTVGGIVAELAVMVDRLPQLFDQLSRALDAQAVAGNIRLDADGAAQWPTALRASAEAVSVLNTANVQATELAFTLRQVNEITSTMARRSDG